MHKEFGKDAYLSHQELGDFTVGDSVYFDLIFNNDQGRLFVKVVCTARDPKEEPKGRPGRPGSQGEARRKASRARKLREEPEERPRGPGNLGQSQTEGKEEAQGRARKKARRPREPRK